MARVLMWWLILALSAGEQWCDLPKAQRFGEWQTLYGKSNHRQDFETSDEIVCSDPDHFRHNRLSATPLPRALMRNDPPIMRLEQVPPVPTAHFVEWSLDNTSFYEVQIEQQGHECQSCWAFTTTTVVEAAASASGMHQMSPQHLINCAVHLPWGYRNQGCDGGYLSPTMRWVMENGLVSDSSVPYTGAQGICQTNAFTVSVGNMQVFPAYNGNGQLMALTEPVLRAMVAQGPTEVAMHASQKLRLHSGGGLFTAEDCGSGEVNHAVVIVGYGATTSGALYWKVANSWGADWNGDGYFLLERGNDACRIESSEAVRPLGVSVSHHHAIKNHTHTTNDDWGLWIALLLLIPLLLAIVYWLQPPPVHTYPPFTYTNPNQLCELPPLTIKL